MFGHMRTEKIGALMSVESVLQGTAIQFSDLNHVELESQNEGSAYMLLCSTSTTHVL